MNSVRFNSMYGGLSAVAKRVYEAVPISESWSAQQIKAELDRRGAGVSKDARVFGGCLCDLVARGLVSEAPHGMFRRVKVSLREAQPPQQKEQVVQSVQKSQPPAKSALDRLSALATQLKAIAGELETVALEMEDERAVDAEGRKRLEQLQQLLKGVINAG